MNYSEPRKILLWEEGSKITLKEATEHYGTKKYSGH